MKLLTHKKATAVVLALAIACIGLLPSDGAASDLGVHMGYYFDADAVAFGFGLLTSISESRNDWFFNPNAELIVGDRDMAALNADVHYDFATSSDLTFWAGAGPGVFILEGPGDDDLDVGLNLLAGFGKQTGSTRPFLQGKAIVKDNTEASLAVGIRF
jgi:hypothetical protein